MIAQEKVMCEYLKFEISVRTKKIKNFFLIFTLVVYFFLVLKVNIEVSVWFRCCKINKAVHFKTSFFIHIGNPTYSWLCS